MNDDLTFFVFVFSFPIRTEGLENGNDPLEQSWSEGMIVASPEK